MDSFEINENQTENISEKESVPVTGLTFEFSERSGLDFESEAEISVSAEQVMNFPLDDSSGQSASVEESYPVKEDEFELPESFKAEEPAASSSFVEDPVRVRTTYVPRFTGVSDNYRMSRIEPTKNDKISVLEMNTAREEVVVSSQIKKEKQSLDPTAEIEEAATVETVVVIPGTAKDNQPKDESISVFKFETDENEEADTDDEQMNIFDLPSVEEVNSPEEPALAEEAQPENSVVSKGNGELPDPDIDFPKVEDSSDEQKAAVSPKSSDSALSGKKGSGEFVSPVQSDEIKDRFLDLLLGTRVRLIAAGLIFLCLTVLQFIDAFGKGSMTLLGLGAVRAASAIIDLQFVICLTLIALPEIIRAIKALKQKKIISDLGLVVSALVLVAYTVMISISDAAEYSVFGVVYAISVFASVLGTYFRHKADFISFKLVSKNTVKSVIDRRLTRELERENMALDGIVDEYNSKTARVFKASFVSDFFARLSIIRENGINTLIVNGISLGMALVSGLVAFLIRDYSIGYFASAFAMVFMLSSPALSLLIFKLPYYRLTKECQSEGNCFVGSASVFEYSDVNVITYEDNEIFGEDDVSIKKVHLFGKAYNMPKAMKHMCSLFAGQGGPLERVFTAALDRKCEAAGDLVVEEDGISGVFEGKRICAGTEEYMRRNNIIIPGDDYKTAPSATDSTKVMYGAEDGEVYVKFFIRYSFSEEFTMLLPILKEQKIVPLIYTRDPNVTNSLVKVLTMGEDLIRVMKQTDSSKGSDKIYRRISSGAVSVGEKSSLINMILIAKRYADFLSGLSLTELVSMIVGSALAVVLAIGGMIFVPTLALALWQAAWCVVLGFISFHSFGGKKKRREDIDD